MNREMRAVHGTSCTRVLSQDLSNLLIGRQINLGRQLMSELIESKGINVFNHLLNECIASHVWEMFGIKRNVAG